MASLSYFYRCYFDRCSSELAQLVPLPFSWGRSTCYSDGFHDFSVTIPRCYKDDYVNSFFPRTPRLWNSLPIECFILMYDLSGFKSGINRHLLTVRSSWTDFLYAVLIGCQIVYYEGITFKMDCKTLQLLDPKQKIFVMVDANLR